VSKIDRNGEVRGTRNAEAVLEIIRAPTDHDTGEPINAACSVREGAVGKGPEPRAPRWRPTSRTAGSASGLGKRTGSNPDTAPQADATTSARQYPHNFTRWRGGRRYLPVYLCSRCGVPVKCVKVRHHLRLLCRDGGMRSWPRARGGWLYSFTGLLQRMPFHPRSGLSGNRCWGPALSVPSHLVGIWLGCAGASGDELRSLRRRR
jgi:hypothetical protein